MAAEYDFSGKLLREFLQGLAEETSPMEELFHAPNEPTRKLFRSRRLK